MASRSARQRVVIGGLLALAIALGLALRLESVEHKRTPSHDEAISFVAATCHQRAYDDLVARGAPPVATKVRAAEWQRLWQVEGKLCFGEIGRGLAETDVHPPLYFWVLHVWSLVAGVGMPEGLWLNLVIVTLTAVALAGLGRQALGDDAEAAALSATWVLSPVAISTSTEARQYDLLALVTVLFVWQLLCVIRPDRPFRARDAIRLAVATAAGVLTEFTFGIVVAGAAIVGAAVLLWRDPRRLAGAGAAIVAGSLAAWMLHPGFRESLETASGQAGPFDASELGDRVERVLATLGELALGKEAGAAVAAGTVVAAVTVLVLAGLSVARLLARHPTARTRGWPVAFLGAWTAAVTIALYLTFTSPRNAMGASYLAPAWPLLAAVPILLLRQVPRIGRPLLGALVAAVFVAGYASVGRVDRSNTRVAEPQSLTGAREPILVDTVRRGLLPAALWHAAPGRMVLAADQETLLRVPLPIHEGGAAVYVSATGLGGTGVGRYRVMRRLRRAGRKVVPTGELVLWDPQRLVGRIVERTYRIAPGGAR